MSAAWNSIGNQEYLKKRILPNPKYQHVRARINTGCSLSKYMEKLEEMKRNYRYRRDELFKRLKLTTFSQLILQVASVNEQNNGISDEEQRLQDSNSVLSAREPELLSIKGNEEDCFTGRQPKTPILMISDNGSGEKVVSARSTLQSVISGVGEIDLEKENGLKPNNKPCVPTHVEIDKPYPECPYLLLDVRDSDAFKECHIIGAYNYPTAMLSRTMNPYTKEVLQYKNVSGKIILVYDEDERLASQAATVLCERGFENLFMLTGGLKLAAHLFPEGLLTGSIPESCQPITPPPSRRRRSAPPEPPLPAQNKFRFTADDLFKINHYLNDCLLPSETASNCSRLSSRTLSTMSNSRAQSMAGSARSSTGSYLNRPWK
uniref:Centrosomal protein 41 n=1 Tax=Callorhinchus milii TaxID=7868 RepID=A0A4W3ILP6_CALMI|eukprot:gi/632947418/ref/XP_007889036.1/ PREDICTED: centrosomal protein of 41 kDa [Callorhinchus milii]